MSEVIDSRIVEMRFDNSQFESNVRESLKTIDHLKSSLDFEDSVKGLEHIKVDIDASGAVQGLNAISDAAEDCDLSQISNSAESVKLSFTALEIVAVTALGKIASAAIDAGAKAVNAFALQPITDGFAEYNQQLKSTRVITSNTGQSLEEVTKVLDELNEYADKTIYSFGDMTQAMGYFTSALGKNSAENSAIIAKGISNWAASTGQGNEVAKRVMYQVSQALSTGSFRLMDWKSIENTGAMAGKVYQDAFLATASGMYNKSIDEILVDKKGAAASFRESLQTGWLTNEVFLETMANFANVENDPNSSFKWMEEAATKVLNFSDLLDTVREQLGTGWGDTWKIVFGTFEDSIKFFTGISDRISNFISTINKARNAIFQEWFDKGGHKLLFGVSEKDVGAIGKLLDGVLELLSQVHEAFLDAFGSEFLADLLLGATEAVSNFAKVFERLSHLTIIHDVLRSIFSVIKSIFNIVNSIYKIIEPFISLALDGVEKILSGVSKIADLTANIIDKIAVKISSLAERITEPFQIASNFISGIFGVALDYVSEKASSIWNFLKQFDIFGIFPNDAPKIFSNSIDIAANKISNFADKVKEVDGTLKDVDNTIKDVTKTTENLGDQWWDLISEEDKNQYFAPQFWGDLSDKQREEWRQYAEEKKLYNVEEYEALAKSSEKTKEISEETKKTNDSLEQSYNSAVKIGESVSITSTDLKKSDDSLKDISKDVEKVNENLEKTPSKVSISLSLGDSEKPEAVKDWWDLISEEDKNQYFAPELWNDLDEKQREEWKKRAEAFELFNVQEYEKIKRSAELSQSYDWWDLIGENDKSKYFIAEYWDDLTDSQKEYWKQYALGLKLFTEEELAQLESTEKTVKDILDDRDKVVQKKRTEADLWWDLIDEDKKKQYFMGEYWDVLNEHERESWRKRAEEYKLFDPEEYAKLLEEMRDAEKEAFAPEVSEDIVESSESIETWYDKASKIPIIGGFLKDFSWIATKTVKNAKSFGSAVKNSFGDFINYAKYINGTDLTFFQKLNLEASYFKEHVAGYLGDLIAKNFKSIGNVISNSDVATKLKTFTTSVKDRFTDFKSYVKDINENTTLTFPEKYKLSLEYFKTNVLGTIGGQIKEKFIELGENIKGNKIVTNAASFISAVKTKFGEFKSYISDLNSNTELTFPQKLTKALEFLKTDVIDYLLELINKNLKSVGIDIKKIGEEISNAFETAITLIITTLNVFGIDTEAIKKFFWNDDGTLKSIPEIITALGDQIEKALIEVKTRLLNLYESFFPSTEEGKLTGPLGWIISAKEKVDGFIESIFGSNKKVKAAQKEAPSNGLLPAVLGILGLGGGSSIMKTVGNLNSLFSFGKNLGISGNINYSKIAIGVALAAGAFALLSKVNFKQLGIDFSGFTNYFKDGEGNLLSVSEIMDKVGQSLSKNKIGKWVVETSQLIGRNFSSAFNLLKDNTVFFGQFIGSLNETDLTFPQKFGLAATFFKDHFVVPFGDLVKKNLKHIGIDIDGFLAKFKNSEGGWLTIADHIKILGDKISAEVEALKQKFDQTALGKWINEQIEKFKAEHPKITAWIESVGENISKVFKKIGELPGLIGRNISSFFIDFAEFFGNFKKHVKELNENTELTFPEKFKTALEYFKKDFIDPFAEIAKRNLKTIGIDIDAFINYFKDNEGNWLSIGEIITKVGNSIRDAFQDLKTKFEQSKFGQWLTEKFNGLSTWFDNFKNLASKFAAPVIGGAGIFLAIRGIFQLFDFVNSIGRIYSGRTPINEANAFARSVEALSIIIKDIAVAVFIIAASLGGLAMLNQDDLTRASDSITHVLTVVGVIMGALTIIAAIRSRTKETNSASLAVLELAGAVFAIAMAFKLITSIQMFDESGNLKLRNLIADFSVLGTLMLMTIGFGRLAPNIEGSKSSFIGMIAIATAVIEMVGALYLVQLMLESHNGVFWALVTLGGLIGAFAVLCRAANGVNWRAGLGLILMARSVRTMLDSLEYVLESDLLSKFGNNWNDILKNIGKIVLVYGALLGLALINNVSGEGRAGLNLLSVAASVLVLAHAIELITEIDEERLWPAVAVVSALSFVMGLILIGYSALGKYSNTSLRAMVTNAVQLYSVVIAAILLCGAVALLATMDQAKLSSSALIVGALTTIVGLISIFMANATGHNSLGENLATLTAVTLVAVAMGALIYALDRYIPDKSNLMTIAGTISLLTGVVGTFAIMFGELDLYYGSMKHVGQIGAVLGEIAIVVAAMGAVLTLVARNIPQDTRWDQLLSIAGAVSIMAAVVSGITLAFGKIKDLKFLDFLELGGTLLAISVVVGLMAAVMAVMANVMPDDATASKLWNIVGTVSAMTVVVSGIAVAFGKIKDLKFPNFLELGGTLLEISVVVALMGLVLSMTANLLPENTDSSKLSGIVKSISVLSGVVAALALVFGNININLSSATKGALALGAIGLVVEALFAFIVIIIGWQKDNIDKAVSIIERLGKGFAKIFDQVMTTIGKLNWWQLVALIGVVAGAVAALALFGPEIAIGIVVFGAAIAVFAAEMAAAAIVCVGLLDITLPWFEQFATEGVPIFEKIAEGIVKIATIIIDGIVANVRTIIDCLVDFVAFASVGFDDEKVGKVVDLATQITKIIGAFMGDDFLGMLGKAAGEWLFGAYNRESFLKNVRTITDALNIVKTETADWTPLDESRITLATTIAGQLVRIVDAFTETNFLRALGKWSVEKAFGNFNRETFEANVQAICGGLNKFVTGINEIKNFDEAKILNAETVADKMIVLVRKFEINGIDGLINKIVNILFSAENAASFNKAIEQIDAAVVDFCSKVNLWVLPSDYESKFSIVDKMIEFVTGMPAINPDRMSIDAFGDAIKAFAKSFLEATFYLNSTLSKNNIEDYSGKMETIDDLIALSEKLPAAASAMGTFFGYKTTEDLKTFSDKFVVFAENLQTFATEMNKVKPIKKWDDKKSVVEDLIALAKLLPEDVSGLDQAISLDPIKSNLAIFGQQIAEFSEWFNSAVAEINEIDITDATFAKYTKMEALVRCLIGLTNMLPESYTISDVSGNAQTMSTFTRSLSAFMNDIMGDQNAIVGGFSNSIFDRVRQVYAELDEIGELTKNGQAALDNITSEDGVLHKLAGLAGSLPEASKNSSTLTQFGQEIYNLSESLSSAYYTVEGLATTSGDDKESFNSGPFEEIAKGVKSIIDSFADISSEDLVHIDSIFDSLRHLKTDDGAGLGEVLLGLAGDFIGEPGNKFTDAIAGAGNASTFLGNIAGLGDTLNSIVPEGGIQLGGLETVFGQFNAESGSFDEGGVLSAIPTSITEFNDLFGENGSIDISNATDALKNMFNFDADSININSDGMKSLFGVFTQGSGFDGTGILSMMPPEIQAYVTNMTGESTSGIADANAVIEDLVGGVTMAGSVTPDLSTNFNTTLSTFATNGITSYTNTFKSEDTIALVNDATTTLVSKTGQGIDAAIKKKPNDLDTACKSTVKMISDILSGDNTNPYSVPGPFILNKTGKGINDALKSSSKTLKDSVKSTVSLIVEILSGDSTNPYSVPGPNILNKLGNGISSALTSSYSTLSSAVNSVVSYVANILSGNSSNPNPYTQAGENAVSGFVAGLSKTDNVYKAAYDIGSLALRGLDDSTDSHSPSKEAEKRGEYIGEGLKNGIDSYKDAIENELDGIYLYDKFSSDFLNMMGDIVGVVDEEGVFWAGETLGNAAIDGIAYVIKSNSPSKEAMKYGKYFSEGFALGISSYSDAVETTSENVGSDALNGLASYVAKVYDLLDSGLEFSPTITPVLDLSELKDGVELANAMFSKQQAYSANMEVKGAIRARTDSARAVSNTDNSRNFGGFTFNIYTQGTDADSIARQIGSEVTRKLRISGALI